LLHYPIDRRESEGFRAADIVLANSMFTAETTKGSFGIEACPVYPGVDTSAFKFSTSDEGYVLTVIGFAHTRISSSFQGSTIFLLQRAYASRSQLQAFLKVGM